jgi:hypothetical protein
MPPQIAMLGWGSLLWEGGADFDRWRNEWRFDGPTLSLEFSRISSSRLGALTLVVDHGLYRHSGLHSRNDHAQASVFLARSR